MSDAPDEAQVQSGGASALDVSAPEPVTMPENMKRAAPRTVSARAREDLVRIAAKCGVVVERQTEHDRSKPHLHFHTKLIQFFSRVKVHRAKFQVKENLQEAMLFANVENGWTVPLLFHKRPGMPYLAVLTADDLFKIIAIAEGTWDHADTSKP